MSQSDAVFLFAGLYPDEAAARADYDVVKALHSLEAVGHFDAAVVTKDAKGKVHVNKDETTTRTGGWSGIAAGAVLGLIFPPSILGTAAVGGAVGAFAGHLWGGMSRSDVKELGDFIDSGEAALVVIGDLTVSEALEKAALRDVKAYRKQLNVEFDQIEKDLKSGS